MAVLLSKDIVRLLSWFFCPFLDSMLVGKAAFAIFLYLEMIDASFSFDGAIGAFAITPDPIIIMLGLGFIGAMFVLSLTIFLVEKEH
ncbi:DUF475 domain-containing protein [Lactococcus lactis]|nr:DUF475 domain-containing protein [Lactococcus lactis]